LESDLSRVWDWLAKAGLDAALFSDPQSVCYLTGYANQTDSSFPFKGCPTLVVVVRGQEPAVVLPGTEQGDFGQASWVRSIFSYPNYDHQCPLDIAAAAQQAGARAMQHCGIGQGVLGFEALHLPASLYQGLGERFRHLRWKDVTGRLASLQAVKTPDELDAIRQSARLCDVGQAKVRELIAPDKSEIAVFAQARACMEQVAGQRIHVAGDLVSGERCGGYGGGLPRSDLLEDGHLVISDIVPCLNGWWADSCATLAVGEPSCEHQKIYRIVADAFELGVETARPGIKASELDALVRGYVEKHGYQYGHHTGHGVGVAQSEAPWIVPYNDEVLQEGMVITIEPGIYPGGTGGVRLEDLFLVTCDHLEPLTRHDKRLEG
jgi:Xaa-Pro dipeptidase